MSLPQTTADVRPHRLLSLPTTRWSLPITRLIFILSLTVLFSGSGVAQDEPVVAIDSATTDITPVAPATSLAVEDYKYDDGERLILTWSLSADDKPVGGTVTGYHLYQIAENAEPEKIAELMPGVTRFVVRELLRETPYRFNLVTLSATSTATSETTASAITEREWLNWNKLNLAIMVLVIAGAVFYFIETARRGKKLFVRRIAGLEAVDEAIGRATEMGRPILYIAGIQDMDDVQTLASLTILGRVAEQVANYDIQIHMPTSRSLVMTAAREIVKASYQTAGRPDAYNEDMIHYVTDEQFGFVAAVDGIMVREKPATVFLLGAFFAESLILAETGNSVGAIQIAGTARPAQIPFFIAACDFTLIGEELFAASAYLAEDPKGLGALKGQDVGKIIAMAAIVLGVAAATLHGMTGAEWLQSVSETLYELFSVTVD